MEYKIEFNDFFEYLELKNIIASKRKLAVDKKAKLYSYFDQFYKLIFAFILFYISFNICYGTILNSVFLFFTVLSLFLIIVFLILFLSFIIEYNRNREGRVGKITFNKDGIVDYADLGYICGFGWDKIDFIVVGKKSMVIFSEYPFCLYFNSKNSKEIIDNIKKYDEGVQVIYRKK